jgi:hypothetical protein
MKRREFIRTAIATGAVISSHELKGFGAEILLQNPENLSASHAIPSLDELAGSWIAANMIELTPALANFHASLEASRNVLGVENFTVPPLSQGGEFAALFLDGDYIPAREFRWFPYQLQRRATQQGMKILTTLRMPFEQAGGLFSIEIENTSAKPVSSSLAINLQASIRRYDVTWEWETLRPEDKDKTDFQTRSMQLGNDQVLYTKDAKSESGAGFIFFPCPNKLSQSAAIAEWTLDLKPGERFSLKGVMAAGNNIDSIAAQVVQWKTDFAATWEQAQALWQKRYFDVFDPQNKHFSGNLPTLVTSDAAIRKMYYGSVLSLLCLERTNFGPQYPRVFVTASPHWATSLMYFWDTSLFATVWALLDPVAMKEQLKLFLGRNIHSGYAIDFLTLKIVGPWYSANDYSVFRLVTTYISVTGDQKFLDEALQGDKRVIDYLDEIALYWRTLTKPSTFLANYGDASNLLETVPTYVNCAPAMNAANVWMMRLLAKIRSMRGEADRARDLNQLADQLAAAVLTLYVDGNGFWACQLTDGKKVEVRHCIDFFTTIASMKQDLGPRRIEEMLAFVDRELWTPHWLRALSVLDEAAGLSTRADHGYTGSYDAWPALTVEATFWVGRKREAFERLRSLAPATREGPFGQSHYVETEQDPVRKALSFGQDYFASASGSFAEVILRTVFGFSPAVGEEWRPVPAVAPGFEGWLSNLRYGSKLVTASIHKAV